MNETVFEKIEAAASVLKLDFSSEEFANFAEEQALSEGAIDAVQAVFSYLSEKKQQTTIQTLLKMSRLPTKAPKTFENFDFSLLKGKDVERLKALAALTAIYSHRNLAFIGPAGTGKTHLAQAKVCPLWPFCPPTFLPDFCRRLFGVGFLYPSDDGGMELFREFLFNCSCSSAMVSSSFALVSRCSESAFWRLSIVCVRFDMMRVSCSFCSLSFFSSSVIQLTPECFI